MEKTRKQQIIEAIAGIGSSATGTIAGVMAGVALNANAESRVVEDEDDIEIISIDNPEKPEPISPEKPEPVKPEPVKPEPEKPEPIKPEPIKPEPVKPETEIEVVDFQRVTDENGNEFDVAILKVDGMDVAVIDADLDGVADAMIMDYNGDGVIDSSEIIDIREQGLDMQLLAQNVKPEQPDDIAVLDYQRMTDPEGHEYDIAVLNIEGTEVAVIDADLDGVADAMLMDVNGDGQIDQSEVFDISGQGLQMQPLAEAFEDNSIPPVGSDMA